MIFSVIDQNILLNRKKKDSIEISMGKDIDLKINKKTLWKTIKNHYGNQ